MAVDVHRDRAHRPVFHLVVEPAGAHQLVELCAPLRSFEPTVLDLLQTVVACKIVCAVAGEEHVRPFIEQPASEADRRPRRAQAETAPARRSRPSMIAASSSMQPLAVNTLPRPALKHGSSSSTRTAASTASSDASCLSRIAAPAASADSRPARAQRSCSGSSTPGRIDPAPPWTTNRHRPVAMPVALAMTLFSRQLTAALQAYNYDISLLGGMNGQR